MALNPQSESSLLNDRFDLEAVIRGHPVSNIARIFCVDPATVTLGINSFRAFQKGDTA